MTSRHEERALELTPSGRVREASSGRTETADFPAFRQATFYGVLAGLCPLIPVPFLDDWVLSRVRRRMVRDLAGREEVDLSEPQVETLAGVGEERRFPGCFAAVGWVLRKVVLKLLLKVFRKLVYVLAMREGLHVATDVFHEGFLLLVAFDRWDAEGVDAARVRAAVRETLTELNLKPTRRTIRRTAKGSRGLLIQGAGVMTDLFRGRRTSRTDEALEKEERLLGGFVDRLAASLWGDRRHFDAARAIFLRHLEPSG